jgi:hypothetical protein
MYESANYEVIVVEVLEDIVLGDLPNYLNDLKMPLNTHVRVVIEEVATSTSIRTHVAKKQRNLADHPAFGMWSDRQDMEDAAAYVRKLREARYINAY